MGSTKYIEKFQGHGTDPHAQIMLCWVHDHPIPNILDVPLPPTLPSIGVLDVVDKGDKLHDPSCDIYMHQVGSIIQLTPKFPSNLFMVDGWLLTYTNPPNSFICMQIIMGIKPTQILTTYKPKTHAS